MKQSPWLKPPFIDGNSRRPAFDAYALVDRTSSFAKLDRDLRRQENKDFDFIMSIKHATPMQILIAAVKEK